MKRKVKSFKKYSILFKMEKLLIEKGRKHAVENKHELAIDYFTEAININPKNTEAHSWRMNEYFLLKEYEKSIKDGEILLEITPNYPDANYVIGVSQLYLKQNEEAIENLTKAAELDKNNFLAYSHRAKAKENLGDYEGAKQDLNLSEKRKEK